MKEWKQTAVAVSWGIAAYVALIWIYTVFEKIQWLDQTKIVQPLMQMAILLTVGFCGILIMKKEQKEQKWHILLCAIVILGMIMRVGYTMYTPWYVRFHDIGNLSMDDAGHASYILHLYGGKLPDTNTYQFYHPPLFHILSAVTMHIVGFITNRDIGEEVFESAKIVSCLAACGVLYQVKEFLRELKIRDDISCIIMAVVCFLPNFYFLAGRINNDSLVLFFMIMAIRYTYKWCEKQTFFHIIPLAFAYGLGMMTKTSCATLAFFTGVCFLVILYKKIREKQSKLIIVQLVVFGMISFPLGLWYQIRNLILFKQPLGYVLKLGEESPTYTGGYTLAARFSPFDWKSLFGNLYNNPFEDYNVPSFLIKSSLFGEFRFEIEELLPGILLVSAVILIIGSLVAMFWILWKGSQPKNIKWGLFALWILQIGSYIYFNLKFPNGCTMDFRYVVPTVVIGAIYLGLAWEKLRQMESLGAKIICNYFTVILMVFSAASIVMFCNIA